MNWQFSYIWVLYFIGVIPLVWIVQGVSNSRQKGMVSSVPSRVAAAGASSRTLTSWTPGFFLSIALGSLLIATARPQEVLDHVTTTQDTIAIELVVDRSGSMKERVMFDGQEHTRLSAVKKVVERFVVGDGTMLGGRDGDLLGLIVFGTFADTLMPLTQSHDVLVEAIRRIKIPEIQREQLTAIGDALMLATARLKATEDAMQIQTKNPEFTLKSKVIILLTDGENSVGTYSPFEAAQLAKEWGIKIYIVGIRGGTSINNFFGGNLQEVSNQRMQQVAQETGGHYWGVDNISELEQVYAQIDELERSAIEISESTSYRELYMPFAIVGFGALLLSSLLKTVVYRRVI